MAKLSTFQDSFSSALSGSWATSGTAVTSNGILDISTAGDAHSVITTYDATSDQTYVRVVRVAIGVSTPVTNMVFQSVTSGTNVRISYYRSSQKLSFESQVSFADGSPVQIPYDPIQHQWWRIREASSVTYFETSPDCVNWTIQRQITSPAWMNSVQLYLSVDNTPQISSKFDNLNVDPSTTYHNWFVRKGGAESNGGDTTSLTPTRSGTDLTNVSGSANIVSLSAAFTSADIGKGICIINSANGNLPTHCRIVSITSSSIAVIDDNSIFGNATNQSWAIGGAVASISALTSNTKASAGLLTSGDNMYIGAGVYREQIAINRSFSGAPVQMIGDIDGTKTGDAGEVQVTQYTTNNTTAPTSSAALTASGKNLWLFANIVFIQGNAVLCAFGDASEITFTNCAFQSTIPGSASGGPTHVFTTAAAHNILYDKCKFFNVGNSTGTSSCVKVTLPTHVSADYDANVVINDCMMLNTNGSGVNIATSGANSFKGGGVYIYNCTAICGAGVPITAAGVTAISTSMPVTIQNCFLMGSSTVLSVGSPAGQMIEDYNILFGSNTTPRATVTAGSHSSSDYSKAPLLSFGQETVWGGQIKPFGMPTVGSGLIGSIGTSGNGPGTDITGFLRPSTALSSTGAYERSNTWVKETGTVRTGSNSLSVTGPGYQDFLVPVDATSTTVSVYMRFDSTYAGTSPQLQLLNGTECGVTNQTITLSGSANTWTQVSVTFTPTSKGIVTIRLVSLSTASAGKAFADDFSVT